MKIALLRNERLAAPAVCAVALVLALVFTRGMTPSFDSVRYANVAHWLAAGEGIATSLTVVPVQEGLPATGDGLHAFTIQPPGLPLFYAATGVDNRAASHRNLHLLSYVLLAWLVLALGRKLSGRSEVGIAAALLTLLSPALLATVANYWTDLPAVTLLFGALYLVIKSREPSPYPWAWLLGASVLSAAAISFRLTALAFGAVLLTDLVLSRDLKWRQQLLRFAAGSGIFGVVTLWILLRNKILAGTFSGTPAHTWLMAPQYSLERGWAFLSSRLLQSLTPGWALDGVAQKMTVAHAQAGIWRVPGALVFLLIVAVGVAYFLRRQQRLSWPRSSGQATPGARTLAMALFIASLVVLLLPAGRHADFRVIEFRYLISLLPLVWIGLMILVLGSGRRFVDFAVAAVLVLIFAVGVPGRHQPYQHSHDYMRAGLDWLKLTAPSETAILTNGGKVLLDEDIARRVYHISDWNFRHALTPEMQDPRGLLHYLQRHDIRYIVLFSTPNMHQAEYWGRPIIGLFLDQLWQPWLAYSDKYLKVYRIPPTGPQPAQR